MLHLFKRDEKEPISFVSVEMQKALRNYIAWMVGILLLGGIITLSGLLSPKS